MFAELFLQAENYLLFHAKLLFQNNPNLMNSFNVLLTFPIEMRDVNFNDYDLHGYLQGERCDMIKTLTINHFDEINFIQQSVNAKTDEKFLHALAIRKNSKQKSILIFKKRKSC